MSETGGWRRPYILRLPLPDRVVCCVCVPSGVLPGTSCGSRQGAVFTGASRKGDLCKHLHLFHGVTAVDMRLECGLCGFVGSGKIPLKSVNAHLHAEHGVATVPRPSIAAPAEHDGFSPVAGRTRSGVRALIAKAHAWASPTGGKARRPGRVGAPRSQRRPAPPGPLPQPPTSTPPSPPSTSTSSPVVFPSPSGSSSPAVPFQAPSSTGVSRTPGPSVAMQHPPASPLIPQRQSAEPHQAGHRPLPVRPPPLTPGQGFSGGLPRVIAKPGSHPRPLTIPPTSIQGGTPSYSTSRERERSEGQRHRSLGPENIARRVGPVHGHTSTPTAPTTSGRAANATASPASPPSSHAGAGASFSPRPPTSGSGGTERPMKGAKRRHRARQPPDATPPSRGVHTPSLAAVREALATKSRALRGSLALNPGAATFVPGVTFAQVVAGGSIPPRSPHASGPHVTLVPATTTLPGSLGTGEPTTSGSPTTAYTTTTTVYTSPRMSPTQQQPRRTPPPSWGPPGLSMPRLSPPSPPTPSSSSPPERFFTPSGVVGLPPGASPWTPARLGAPIAKNTIATLSPVHPNRNRTTTTNIGRGARSPPKTPPQPPRRMSVSEGGWRTVTPPRRRGSQRGSNDISHNDRVGVALPVGAAGTPPSPTPLRGLGSGRVPPSASRDGGTAATTRQLTPTPQASGPRILSVVGLRRKVTIDRSSATLRESPASAGAGERAAVADKHHKDCGKNGASGRNNKNNNKNNNDGNNSVPNQGEIGDRAIKFNKLNKLNNVNNNKIKNNNYYNDNKNNNNNDNNNNNNNNNNAANGSSRGPIHVNKRFDLATVTAAIRAAASAQCSGAGVNVCASGTNACVANASGGTASPSVSQAVGEPAIACGMSAERVNVRNECASESEDEFDTIVQLIDKSVRVDGGMGDGASVSARESECVGENVSRPPQDSSTGETRFAGGVGGSGRPPTPGGSRREAGLGVEIPEAVQTGGRRRDERAAAQPDEEQLALMSLASLASGPEDLEELATFVLQYLLSKLGPSGPREEGRAPRQERKGGRRSGKHDAEGRVNPSGGLTFGLPRAERERWTAAARKTQFLYKTNRRRVMREMIGGPDQRCESSVEEVHRHFERIHGIQVAGGSAPLSFPVEDPDPVSCEELVRPFDAAWVSIKLRGMHNTSPGPDGITYAQLKRADPGCHVLAAVYNACLRMGRIPRGWRSSVTVLLLKKGDPGILDNWRPIAMGDTIAKLLAALIADRLTAWAVQNRRLSPAQKGFLRYEGCLEHNFVLREAIDSANREKREIAVSWLDLSNAFGSIPHETIRVALLRHGVPEAIRGLIFSAYEGATTTIRVAQGTTEPVPILAGVRQGCPLSPIIFNLTLEPVIRAIEGLGGGYGLWGARVNSLFYADDGALVAASARGLQAALDVADATAAALGLRFNPSKCASLHLAGGGGPRVRDTRFTIRGEAMRALGPGESYSHLGTPTGFRVRQTPYASIQEVESDVKTIDSSLLAPWQKFDAVATFILPRLDFCMRGSAVAKGPLNAADKILKRVAKSWLNLPRRASAEVVFLPPSMGGGGLLPLSDMADVLTVAHAFRMLNAEDPAVRALAASSLDDAVGRRLGARPGPEDLAAYLSGSSEGRLARPAGDMASFWSRTRNATRRLSSKLGLTWHWTPERAELAIECRGLQAGNVIIPPAAKGQVIGRLRFALVDHFRERLLAKRDQGKVYKVTVRNGVSNHFLRDGRFLRFADWRFLHRARLDVLPLNATKRWATHADVRCRCCGASRETLPHVLQHCGPHFAAIQRRHNAVLERLATAIRVEGEVRTNQTVIGVTGDNASLRPDLVVRDEAGGRVIIVDVAISFENEPAALEESRERKLSAYASLAQELHGQGYEVMVHAFVVGPLGGWLATNEVVLRVLEVNKRYASTLRKLMVCDAVRWSRDIYVEHMTGRRQYAELPGADQ